APSPELVTFAPRFAAALRHLSPEVANAYVTGGELILDIALLRSIADYTDDAMAHAVMQLVNRDESRHIAMDYFMTEYYAAGRHDARRGPRSLLDHARAAWAFAALLHAAKPFVTVVFFEPSRVADPSGRRMKEAFKRLQLLAAKPHLVDRPFAKFMTSLRTAFNTPVVGRVLGRVICRILAAPPELLVDLYSEDEARRARAMTIEELAAEALGAKHLPA
ncbi:MAG TPA: hypothetical protein VHB21_21700, partial [Minicystis sp.]|nr:hypothetical protein [Minicystis sp.]